MAGVHCFQQMNDMRAVLYSSQMQPRRGFTMLLRANKPLLPANAIANAPVAGQHNNGIMARYTPAAQGGAGQEGDGIPFEWS